MKLYFQVIKQVLREDLKNTENFMVEHCTSDDEIKSYLYQHKNQLLEKFKELLLTSSTDIQITFHISNQLTN